MGASLLVFANKTDVSGCMTDDEIRKVRERYFHCPVSRREIDICRNCNSMRSRRISGPSSDAAQSRGIICKKDWRGWYRTQKTDCSCTESRDMGYGLRREWIATLATPRTRLELTGCS